MRKSITGDSDFATIHSSIVGWAIQTKRGIMLLSVLVSAFCMMGNLESK